MLSLFLHIPPCLRLPWHVSRFPVECFLPVSSFTFYNSIFSDFEMVVVGALRARMTVYRIYRLPRWTLSEHSNSDSYSILLVWCDWFLIPMSHCTLSPLHFRLMTFGPSKTLFLILSARDMSAYVCPELGHPQFTYHWSAFLLLLFDTISAIPYPFVLIDDRHAYHLPV